MCRISHCCNLQFPHDIPCGSSFHMFIYHLYIFFDEMSVQIDLLPLFNKVFIFFLLSFDIYLIFSVKLRVFNLGCVLALSNNKDMIYLFTQINESQTEAPEDLYHPDCLLDSTSRISYLAVGVNLRICIFNKFPGDGYHTWRTIPLGQVNQFF